MSSSRRIAEVVGLADTGTTINKNPRIELRLRIEPQDGSASFEGTKTATMSRLQLPYVGQRYPVWFDRADQTKFMLGTEVTPDASLAVRQLFAHAAAGDPGRPTGQVTAPPAATVPDSLDQLAKLHELRQAGALTYAEFETQKAKLLGTD